MRQNCDEMLGNFAALQEQSHPLADRSVRCTDEPGVSSKQKSLANFATGGGLMFYDYCASSHTGAALAVRHLSAELSIRGRGSISRAVPICIIERVCSIHAVNNHQTVNLAQRIDRSRMPSPLANATPLAGLARAALHRFAACLTALRWPRLIDLRTVSIRRAIN
jgi:hypothetical protein